MVGGIASRLIQSLSLGSTPEASTRVSTQAKTRGARWSASAMGVGSKWVS